MAKIRHPGRSLGKDDSIAVFRLGSSTIFFMKDYKQAENKRTTEDKAKQKEDDARQERFRRLNVTKSRYDSDIFEVSRVVRKLTADLKRLQDQVDEDSRKEREGNSWVASLRDKEAKLKRLPSALQDVNSQISVEKQKAEYAASAQVMERKARMEQEARDRAQEEMRERLAKAQKEHAERAAKEAREAQAAREAGEAQERERKATIAATAERRSREAEEAARKGKEAQNERSKPAPSFSGFFDSTNSTCQHRRFWAKVEGRQLCRNFLRGQKRKSYNTGWKDDFDSYDDYYTDFSSSYYDYD
ncbi:hypothetical protein GJ744_009489 [Endocarpon pusillum]|uniref:Uncharacterized protein n=1 Tax=Endocarpon pusillum TaxID=364733 RepID=A0A8H7AJP3_9EURO|nr:hypothetical protein GJ744_009489 [Endocarpon pusillum]